MSDRASESSASASSGDEAVALTEVHHAADQQAELTPTTSHLGDQLQSAASATQQEEDCTFPLHRVSHSTSTTNGVGVDGASRLTTATSTPVVAPIKSRDGNEPKVLLPAEAVVDQEESGVSALACVLQTICGGSIYGFNTAIISGLNTPLIEDLFFPNSTSSFQATMTGVLTSSILIGAFISTMLSLPFTDRFGRKVSFIVCGAICVLAALALGIAEGFVAIVLVRAVLGLSVGMTATVCPLYSAECAPVAKRGVVGTMFQVSVVFAILVAEVINYGFNPSNTTALASWAWRTQLALGAIPGLGLLLMGIFLPESPVWIAHRRLTLERKETALRHKAAGTIDPAVAAAAVAASSSTPRGWVGLFHISNIRWLALTLLLAAANQLTGVNAIIYYAPTIFSDAGYESQSLVLTIAVVGTWNLVAVLISLPLIKRYSRRSMMIAGQLIMAAGLILITVVFCFFAEQRAIPSILAIILFLFGFEIGPGPLFFVLASEAFPNPILHAGLSLANQSAWSFNILITFCFPLLKVAIGGGATFSLFLLVCILTIIGCVLLIPRGIEQHVVSAEDSQLKAISALAQEDEDEMAAIPSPEQPQAALTAA